MASKENSFTKVLILIGSFKTGGAERMSINTGEELLKRGYDVYFVVQRPIFEIPHQIPEDRIKVLLKKNNPSQYEKVTALFFGIFKINRMLKPDVIIAFSRFSSLLSCFSFNKNIIARFDMDPYSLSKKQHRWANYVLRSSNIKSVIVPSSGMLKALKNKKPEFTGKFQTLPNSIKMGEVETKANDEIEVSYDFPYISAMGRMSLQKNFQLLIRAFAQSEIHNIYRLVLVGDGKLRNELEKLVSSLGMSSKIIFTGQLTNPYPVISKSNFFVNTSLKESFCNVILEALALGRPVIATNCEHGPADMIDNGTNGFLIENNNLSELTSKLNQLGSDKLLQKNFSKNAKASARKFDINKIGDSWQNLISNY